MTAGQDPLLAAARRILDSAGQDLERGHWLSACVSAQRAAVMATEAWLRGEGQPHVSGSVHENVCLSPVSGPEVREAAALLDRHRIEEGYPHRSSAADTDPRAEADRVVAAGRKVLAFVEERLGAAGEQ
ncbi:MAG: HEPN domain-containing protein [Gemmatimonadota bacterium]